MSLSKIAVVMNGWPHIRLFTTLPCSKSKTLNKKLRFPLRISSVNVTRKLQIWSPLLKKSLMENFIFCAVKVIWKVVKKITYQWFIYTYLVAQNTIRCRTYGIWMLLSQFAGGKKLYTVTFLVVHCKNNWLL